MTDNFEIKTRREYQEMSIEELQQIRRQLRKDILAREMEFNVITSVIGQRLINQTNEANEELLRTLPIEPSNLARAMKKQ